MENGEKGRICVTGGTGYIASSLIMRLLQLGYHVNTTIRRCCHEDVSFLKGLPGASTRLKIFDADLDKPHSFLAPIEGCIGVFHLAHPMNLDGKESEEMHVQRSVMGTLGILQACLDSKTVRRVVYTSSAATVIYHGKDLEISNEECWSDQDYVRANFEGLGGYYLSKIATERAALDFADKNGLDLVTLIPPVVHGPFICPNLPFSIRWAMAMIFGDEELYKLLMRTIMVHVDDLVDAFTFLFEHPDAKGRYICSAVEVTMKEMSEFLSARYPELQIPTIEKLKDVNGIENPSLSSQKLLDMGFKFKYGLEEMYDQAIESCKHKGFL